MEPENDISEIHSLRNMLRSFSDERDWGKFHTPKNLATALSVESAELLEPFQWLENGRAEELGADKLAEVRMELADVFAYLVMLADKLNIDLVLALAEKIELNKLKYPVEMVRGDSRKYSDYES
jgi:NTP pyrophosphatase (non-canonical NTP hydrolase)